LRPPPDWTLTFPLVNRCVSRHNSGADNVDHS
jgi:hypothetical protein